MRLEQRPITGEKDTEILNGAASLFITSDIILGNSAELQIEEVHF